MRKLTPDTDLQIGPHLRAAREAAGLSQHKAAHAAGVTQASISQWEKGASPPNLRAVLALAETYGVSPLRLLGLSAVGEYAQGWQDGWEACRQAAHAATDPSNEEEGA